MAYVEGRDDFVGATGRLRPEVDGDSSHARDNQTFTALATDDTTRCPSVIYALRNGCLRSAPALPLPRVRRFPSGTPDLPGGFHACSLVRAHAAVHPDPRCPPH